MKLKDFNHNMNAKHVQKAEHAMDKKRSKQQKGFRRMYVN